MAKSKQTSQKKEKEKIKSLRRKEKEERKKERKNNSNKGKGFESMIAYVDHLGRLTDTPPDPKLRTEMKLEDIQLGARSDAPDQSDSHVRKGRVILYKEDKGYGFIKDSVTKEQVFFHSSNLKENISQGDMVNFVFIKGPKGTAAGEVSRCV